MAANSSGLVVLHKTIRLSRMAGSFYRKANKGTQATRILASNASDANSPHHLLQHYHQTPYSSPSPIRFLNTSTAAAVALTDSSSTTGSRNFSTDGYMARKKAAKDRRREIYQSRQERKTRLVTRRRRQQGEQSSGDNNNKRRAFRSWFIQKKVDEEYMNRKARQAGLAWQIRVAVLLERINVVMPDMEDWQVQFENLSTYLMQFGKEYPQALFPVDYEQPKAITNEELMELLPKGFVPAPRETEADLSGNVRTTDRKLKTNIFLAVQQQQDNDSDAKWQLPETELQEDETILDAARRAIHETVGEELEFWCPSNCPCAVDMVAFPEEKRTNGYYGIKTFFMKIQYDDGAVSLDQNTNRSNVKDFAWLDRDEFVGRIQEQQGDYVAKFYKYLL